jgi:hypothetical protein
VQPQRFSRVEKVNGKEMKLEATEDELFAALRHKAATMEAAKRNAEERRKFQEERQAFLAEQKRLGEDPFHHLRSDPNFNELQWLQDRLHGALRANERSPLEIENERLRNEMQRYQEEVSRRDQEAKSAAELEQENNELRALGANFARALKEGKFPANDLTLDIMGKMHFEAEENGIELSPGELVQETRRMYAEALDNCADNMEDAQLLEAFPKFSAKLHRALVAKYKAMQAGGQQQPSAAPPPPAQPQQQTNGAKRLTEREEWERMQAEASGQGRRILRTL